MAFKSRLKCLFLKPIFCILFATFLHFARNTTAQQPEAHGKIRSTLLIGAALAEATAIYGFVLGILIILMVK